MKKTKFNFVYCRARFAARNLLKAKSLSVSPIKAAWYGFYGFSVDDIACYHLNRKNYKNYISYIQGEKPHRINHCGDISANKITFSEVFGKYVQVPENVGVIFKGQFHPLPAAHTKCAGMDALCELLQKETLYVKPLYGSNGNGILHLSHTRGGYSVEEGKVLNRESFEKFVATLDNMLVQRCVQQGKFANQLFPKTVNTLRLVSIREEGKSYHKIVVGVQRVGTNKSLPVDNFNQDGVAFEVDVETGVIGRGTGRYFFDENKERYFIEKHPDTNEQISGLVIPEFDKIKSKIIDLTKQLPLFEFVAWDIVLLDDGEIALIEINLASGLNVFQVFGDISDTELGRFIRAIP